MIVATTAHGVVGATEVGVLGQNGQQVSGRVVARDEDRDLAMVVTSLVGVEQLPFGDAAVIRRGDPLYCLAHTGSSISVTRGVLSDRLRNQATDFLQTDVTMSRGSDGAPVVDAGGALVGVAVGDFVGSEGKRYAIASNVAVAALRNLADWVGGADPPKGDQWRIADPRMPIDAEVEMNQGTAFQQMSARNASWRHAVAWTGRELIVWGRGGGGRYDPARDEWRALPKADAPRPSAYATMVWTGREAIVWAGKDAGASYDPERDVWSSVPTEGAPDIWFHTAVWTGEEMIVWRGGAGARYNPASRTWTPVSQRGTPGISSDHQAVWTGSRMIVWGGQSAFPPVEWLNKGGQYDPRTDTWTPITTKGAPAGRSQHSMAWSGDEILVWGGYRGGKDQRTFFDDGGRYDPEADEWEPIARNEGPPRLEQHAVAWTGHDLFVWGRSAGTGAPVGRRFNPVSLLWSPLPTSPAVPGVRDPCAIWSGREVLVLGGNVATFDARAKFVPTLARYLPPSRPPAL